MYIPSHLFRDNANLIRRRKQVGMPVKTSAGPPLMDILTLSAENPSYVVNSQGKAVFLTGSHTWENNQAQGVGSFSWNTYLSNLKTWGHNFVRLWVWEQSYAPSGAGGAGVVHSTTTITPEIYGRSSTPGAADGGNKFDLTTYNSSYFEQVRSRVDDCYKNGIYISIMLFDGWSVSEKTGVVDPWPYHPYKSINNVNSVNGDTNGDGNGYETQNNSNATITGLQEDYVEHLIDTVNSYPNVIYEICNEPDGSVSGTYAWIEHFVDHIKTYEATKARQHLVMYSNPFPTGTDLENQFTNTSAEILSHPGGNVNAAMGKMLMSDTDHFFGIGGSADWAWQEFCWGAGAVLYMDSWNNDWLDCSGDGHPIQNFRDNLGYIRDFADRADLIHVDPQAFEGEIFPTSWGLKPVSASYHQYIGYQSTAANQSVNLASESGSTTFAIRKVNLGTGNIDTAQTVLGGASRSITLPAGWTGGWAFWIYPA